MWLCSKGKHSVMCEVIHVKCSYFTYCKNVNNYTTGLAQRPFTYSLTCTHQADEALWFYTDRQGRLSKNCEGTIQCSLSFQAEGRTSKTGQQSTSSPWCLENQLWMVREWVHMWPRMWFPSTGKVASRNLSPRIVKEGNNGKCTAHPAWYQGMGMAHCLGL